MKKQAETQKLNAWSGKNSTLPPNCHDHVQFQIQEKFFRTRAEYLVIEQRKTPEQTHATQIRPSRHIFEIHDAFVVVFGCFPVTASPQRAIRPEVAASLQQIVRCSIGVPSWSGYSLEMVAWCRLRAAQLRDKVAPNKWTFNRFVIASSVRTPPRHHKKCRQSSRPTWTWWNIASTSAANVTDSFRNPSKLPSKWLFKPAPCINSWLRDTPLNCIALHIQILHAVYQSVMTT